MSRVWGLGFRCLWLRDSSFSVRDLGRVGFSGTVLLNTRTHTHRDRDQDPQTLMSRALSLGVYENFLKQGTTLHTLSYFKPYYPHNRHPPQDRNPPPPIFGSRLMILSPKT